MIKRQSSYVLGWRFLLQKSTIAITGDGALI